jgi:hypothetical protein
MDRIWRAAITIRRAVDMRFQLVALVSLGLTAASAAYVVAFGQHVSWNHGCGDDGLEYCSMVLGIPVIDPYSRRLLAPWLVRLLTTDLDQLPAAFFLMNLVGLVVVALGAGLLTHRLAVLLRARQARARWAGLLAASLLILSPMGFAFVSYYPVLVDDVAAALAIAWLLCFFSRRWFWLSLPLAAAAVLTREPWLSVIAAIAVSRLPLQRDRLTFWRTGATLLAVAMATGLGLAVSGMNGRPNLEIGQPFARYGVASNLLHYVVFPQHYLWMGFFVCGLLPLLLLHWRAYRRLIQANREAALLVYPILAGLLVQALQELVAGYDVHRFLFGVLPMVVALVLGLAARKPRLDGELILLLIASLILWRPFQVVAGTHDAYLRYYSPVYVSNAMQLVRFADDLLRVSPLLLAWIAFLLMQRCPGLVRPPGGLDGGPPAPATADA